MKRKGASVSHSKTPRDVYKVTITIVSSHNRFSIFVCYHDSTYYLVCRRDIPWYTVRIEYLCHLSSMHGIESFGEIDEKDNSCQIVCICAFDNLLTVSICPEVDLLVIKPF